MQSLAVTRSRVWQWWYWPKCIVRQSYWRRSQEVRGQGTRRINCVNTENIENQGTVEKKTMGAHIFSTPREWPRVLLIITQGAVAGSAGVLAITFKGIRGLYGEVMENDLKLVMRCKTDTLTLFKGSVIGKSPAVETWIRRWVSVGPRQKRGHSEQRLIIQGTKIPSTKVAFTSYRNWISKHFHFQNMI